jgi:DNA-binding NtrC family response regulator
MDDLGSLKRGERPGPAGAARRPSDATRRNGAAPESKGRGRSAADGVACVIVADDDRDTRRLLAAAIRSTGLEVIEACDGRELLGHFSALGGAPALRLIVSDVQMPHCTGLSALAEIREASPSLPVILITAFGDEDTHAEARRLGAAAVFNKPFDLRQLMASVRNLSLVE